MPSHPLRVLQVINSLQRGGAETLLINYHHSIDRQRLQFDYLLSCPFESTYEAEAKQLGGNVFHVAYKSTSPLGKLSYLARLFYFLLTHRYPIIHIHLAPQAAIWPLLFAKLLRFKHRIIHSHNTNTTQPLSPAALRRVKQRIDTSATDFFGCGTDAANFLFGKANVQSGRAKVIINAINARNFTFCRSNAIARRAELGVEPSEILLGAIARLEKQKNHLFMLEILRLLQKKGNKWTLTVVGSGSLEQTIREKINDLDLTSKVRMVGTTDAVSEYLSAFDLLLMPSLYEDSPLSVIEAQAAALPILASQGRVTDEVPCPSLIHFLPLEDGATAWAEWIARFEPNERKEGSLPPGLWHEGYDIAAAAPKLTALYEAMVQ